MSYCMRIGLLSIIVYLFLPIGVSASFDILPCAAGNKWEYERVKVVIATITFDGRIVAGVNEASSGSSVYQVESKEAAGYRYTETVNMRSSKGGLADDEKSELLIVADEAGLKIAKSSSDDGSENAPKNEIYDPPLLYYIRDTGVGKSWDVGIMREGEAKNFTKARGVSKETVTVPAGTFKDCLKVVYSADDVSGSLDIWNKSFKITGGKSRGIYWIAEGVGVVKELEVATTLAETTGPQGKMLKVDAITCSVSELKAGYKVIK